MTIDRKKFRLRTLGASAALASLVSAPIYADWQAAFKRGIQASEQERWDEVAEAMREAIAERPAARKRRIPIYSSKTVIYIPNAMLAIALAKSDQCRDAWEYFTIAETQGIVQSDRERFTIMQQEKTACRDRLVKQALDDVQPLVEEAQAIRAAIDQLLRGEGARTIWDANQTLASNFDEGKEALSRATVRMEEGVSNGDFKAIEPAAGLARDAIAELKAVRRDFNVKLNAGVASLIATAQPAVRAAETKAREVDAKKADAGRGWTTQLEQMTRDAKAKLASAQSDFDAGRSGDEGKLTSAKTKADEAARDFDRILETRTTTPTRRDEATTDTRQGPTREQRRAADLAVTEARQARQALQNSLGSGDDSQRSRARDFSRQFDQLSTSITRAKNGRDASTLVRLTGQMSQLTANLRDLETEVLRRASAGGEETDRPAPGDAPEPAADGIPQALRLAASSYFSGDYEEALRQAGSESFSGKAQGQALLFRAAAHFALYQLSGDASSREAANAAAVEMKALADPPAPTNRYFSPAFLEFVESASN